MSYLNEIPSLKLAEQLSSGDYDALIVLSKNVVAEEQPAKAALKSATDVDASIAKDVSLIVADGVPGKRLVLAPVGPTNRDFDDVRVITEVARAAINRAKKAGSVRPLIYFGDLPRTELYANVVEAVVLAVYQELYQSLQARETSKNGSTLEPVKALGVFDSKGAVTQAHLDTLRSIEASRRLSRDLADADCERMAPVNFANHVKETFAKLAAPNLKVEVIDDQAYLEKEYPLLMSVARAAKNVPRHHSRVVRLQYIAPDAATDGADIKSVFLVGKGVTYDTGGADVKVGGHMMGMSRDKTGASVVAGFMHLVGLVQPSKTRVYAELGIVRNSVGSEMYVSDENIRGHSGQRVKIVNTDAEGRLVMADCLSHLREIAAKAVNPQMYTIATLTGHAGACFGQNTVVIDNGAAQKTSNAQKLSAHGFQWADPIEISTYRREDFKSVQGKNASFDVLQADSGYARRHQLANAFLIQASGLGAHGIDSEKPLAYTYIDIAPSACENDDYKYGKSVAASMLALYAVHLKK